MIRIAIGGIAHETNTFAAAPTVLDDFRANRLYDGQAFDALRGTNTVIGGALQAADADPDVELLPTMSGSAIPGGTVASEAFEHIVGSISASLESQSVDAVVLDLHGALVVDGFPGGDGEVARRVRAIVGPNVPVVATFDLHGNINDVLTEAADVLVPFDTYPHIDNADRGAEAIRIAADMVRKKITPVSRAVKISASPPSPNQFSGMEPSKSLQALARQWESQPGVINVGIFYSFPYADVPHNGMAVVATTDKDAALAERICAEVGQAVIDRHMEFWPDLMSVEGAVHAAMEEPTGPVVLADFGDNPGGGTTSDSTALLWALIDLGAKDAALAVMCDPEVVALAFEAGIGAEITTEIGGKIDGYHGAPIPITATVRNLTDGAFTYEGPMNTGVRDSLGRTAVLVCQGRYGAEVLVVCSERRVQALDTAIFRSQGIEPTECKIVVVKSGVHFRGAFMPIASRVIVVDSPGILQLDVSAFPFQNLTRPLWPHDDITPSMRPMLHR